MPISHLYPRKPEWETARRAGLSKSPKARAALDAIRPAAFAELERVRHARPKIAKGPLNCTSIPYALRSPDGTAHRGMNLADFVREHAELFLPRDLVGAHPVHCRAYKGLHMIVSGYYPRWKGWERAC